MNDMIAKIKQDTSGFDARQLLEYALNQFSDHIAFASSFGAEDQVLTDIICELAPKTTIFTLDTGRLPQETYDLIEQTRTRYGIEIKVLFPDSQLVEAMVNKSGPNLFYDNIENRKLCCQVRKIQPLKRALSGLDAWICGLRTEQSTTRTALAPIEWDDNFNLIKICPLADWTTEQVWEYIRHKDIPYNKLHDQGYPSIGCAPCTRAVKDNEDIRAGRWWWEAPEHKECGLHLHSDDNKESK